MLRLIQQVPLLVGNAPADKQNLENDCICMYVRVWLSYP